MKKRALSLLLVLLMALALLPEPALADADPSGNVHINEENFPNEHFRAYVRGFTHSGTGDDPFFTPAQLTAVTEINVGGYHAMGDLTGIEYFTALEKLLCWGNTLSALDVSRNTALKELQCHENRLTALDVSRNTALEFLSCDGNSIQELDISNNPYLCDAYLNGTVKEYFKDSYYLSVDYNTKVITEHPEPEVKKPVIKTQPKSVTVKAGKKAAFKVKATGTGLKYQWYVKKTGAKKWTAVKKAVKATYKVKVTKKMNGWKYRCKVYNTGGYVYTKTVKLKVKK